MFQDKRQEQKATTWMKDTAVDRNSVKRTSVTLAGTHHRWKRWPVSGPWWAYTDSKEEFVVQDKLQVATGGNTGITTNSRYLKLYKIKN